MTEDEIAQIKRQSQEQASWGSVSQYGRTGRITSLHSADDVKTVKVGTPAGPLTAKVGAGTAIHKTTEEGSRTLTFEDLVVNTLPD